MKWFRKKRNKAAAALVAAAVMSWLVNTGVMAFAPESGSIWERQIVRGDDEEEAKEAAPGMEQNFTPVCAWWGTIYPKFCFSERKKGRVKISFWLAKALKWC